MHRFFLPPEACQADHCVLSGAEAHHARRVLRLRNQESVEVLDGCGSRLACVVESIRPDELELRVIQRSHAVPYPWTLVLAAALTKHKAWDSTLQKATELGVGVILPLETERSVIRIAAEERQQKIDDWRATLIESAKQCGTPWLPIMESSRPVLEWLKNRGTDSPLLLASLDPAAPSIRMVFDTLQRIQPEPIKKTTVAIGPEGDFSPAEVDAFIQAGAIPMTLGRWTLRSDTASIAALALIGAEFENRLGRIN